MQLGALEYLISINNKGLNKGINDSEKQVKGLGDRFGNTMTKASRQLTNFGDKISAWAVAKGKLIASAIEGITTKTAAAVKQVIGGAINAYADFEQLVGGVETLFGTRGAQSAEEYGKMVGLSGKKAEEAYARVQAAQDMVLANSKKAYQTAGISANRYMENATSFAASLVSSLHGDTYKAAELTDIAIQDMADNANKMGSSMESIENAYAGFAKQNYTMLDNLKLGYGGTKEEMERLLKDAGALAGKKFDASNFSDIVEAIHIIQENKGITGTTAKEAASTISGSINMMKASWQNLLTAMADPDGDIDLVAEQFMTSFETVFKNIKPVFKKTLQSLGKLIVKALPEIFRFIRHDLLPELGNIIQWLMKNIQWPTWDDIKAALGRVWDGIVEGVKGLAKIIFGENIDGSIDWPTWDEVKEAAGRAWRTIVDGVKSLGTSIGKAIFGENVDGEIDWPTWEEVEQAVLTAWRGIVDGVKDLGTRIGKAIFGENVDGEIDWPTWEEVGDAAIKALRGIIDGVKKLGTLVGKAIFGENVDGSIKWPTWDDVKEFAEKAWRGIVDGVKGLGKSIGKAIFGENLDGEIDWPTWDDVKEFAGRAWQSIVDGVKNLGQTIGKAIFGENVDGEIDWPTWDDIKEALSSAWQAIVDGVKKLPDLIFGEGSQVSQDIKDAIQWIEDRIQEFRDFLTNPTKKAKVTILGYDPDKDYGDALNGTGVGEHILSLWNGGTTGNHAKGSNYVPYDNYPALLHRGEAVLTASQARRYRDGEDGVDMSALIPAVVAAIREGMNGAQVNSFMDSTRVTKETNGVTGRKLMAGRFAMV